LTDRECEKMVCDKLRWDGFWVYHCQRGTHGEQAMDVIAMRNGVAYLIEVKHCESDSFPLSRVEYNQERTYDRWVQCGGTHVYFALYFERHKQLLFVPARYVMERLGESNADGKKSISYNDAVKEAVTVC